MSKIQVRTTLIYEVRQPTNFLFNIGVEQSDYQRCLEEHFTSNPEVPIEACNVGAEGNRLHRAFVQPCELRIDYSALVELTPEVDTSCEVGETDISQLPPQVLPYLNPSRYCESDLLARFAFEEFGQLPRGYQRVQAIADWVNDHLDYEPGTTSGTTTAADVLLQRAGVCRDYAHLAVALCRGIGVPARYLAAYAVDLQPPDFHGVFEAFLDGHWYLFDATRLAPVQGFVRIGTGRDAADVAFATLNGVAILQEKTVTTVWADDAPHQDPPPADEAIATA
ncbi:Transglutaminase-like superfamily protein [Pseudobythopirellula maris]|uniref:Transglutaminase-like superfamily protein n=1 Tax=Pseudobythopirellula maris TaxID=2527991 RepID=A0A5C5ZTD9_9BACT|nr:transglutaminase family protein [Pseudobythopirellula maris]TWT90486.1 Transglutaminase-like superfamily protein [Pseudobythopirellula maris]